MVGVWMARWGGYACRLKVRVGGLAWSAREKKQRKQEVSLLTLRVLTAGKLTFIQENDGEKEPCLFPAFQGAVLIGTSSPPKSPNSILEHKLNEYFQHLE